jgi:tol-pal system protein YbgF
MALPMRTPRFATAALLTLACLVAPPASAALFEDDEARRAILELRQRVDAQRKALESGIGEAMSAYAAEQRRQIDEQRRQFEELRRVNEELGALTRRSLLDLANQIEALRGEIARLRGQDEQLARDVAEVQRRHKDIAEASSKTDERLRKLEPVKVSLDGKEFSADAAEKTEFEVALAAFRKGDFPLAQTAFTDFLRRHGSSGYRPNALYWLGNAQYAVRDYKDAIGSFRAFLSAAPEHARAPDALLAVANCQIELKDLKAARKTLGDVGTLYAQSEAAQAAKERLARLK